jgi:hypothetical protein
MRAPLPPITRILFKHLRNRSKNTSISSSAPSGYQCNFQTKGTANIQRRIRYMVLRCPGGDTDDLVRHVRQSGLVGSISGTLWRLDIPGSFGLMLACHGWGRERLGVLLMEFERLDERVTDPYKRVDIGSHS